MRISFPAPNPASAPESESAAFGKRTLEVFFLFHQEMSGDQAVQ